MASMLPTEELPPTVPFTAQARRAGLVLMLVVNCWVAPAMRSAVAGVTVAVSGVTPLEEPPPQPETAAEMMSANRANANLEVDMASASGPKD